MKEMIKYELTKLVRGKIIILAVLLFLFTAYGAYWAWWYIDPYHGVSSTPNEYIGHADEVREIDISDENREAFIAEYYAFINDDDNYEPYDENYTGVICGRYVDFNPIPPDGGAIISADDYTPADGEKRLTIHRDSMMEYINMREPYWKLYNHMSNLEQYRQDAEYYPDGSAEELIALQKCTQTQKALSFRYGYCAGWNYILDLLGGTAGIVLALMTVFTLSGVFTGEYASGADALLLSGKNGKRALILAKLSACGIFILGAWLSALLIASIIGFSLFGFAGADVSLSAIWFKLPYDVTTLEGTLILSGVLLLCLLVIGAVTLAVSSLLKKPVASISVSLLLMLAPYLLVNFFPSSASIRELTQMLPINRTWLHHFYANYICIAGRVMDDKVLLLPFYAIAALLLCLVAARAFRRRQVDG